MWHRFCTAMRSKTHPYRFENQWFQIAAHEGSLKFWKKHARVEITPNWYYFPSFLCHYLVQRAVQWSLMTPSIAFMTKFSSGENTATGNFQEKVILADMFHIFDGYFSASAKPKSIINATSKINEPVRNKEPTFTLLAYHNFCGIFANKGRHMFKAKYVCLWYYLISYSKIFDNKCPFEDQRLSITKH